LPRSNINKYKSQPNLLGIRKTKLEEQQPGAGHQQLQLTILYSDVILEDGVPLLENNLLTPCSSLCRNEFLEIPDRIILVTFDPDLLSQPIVTSYFNHCGS
jgi:hypothetical protein